MIKKYLEMVWLIVAGFVLISMSRDFFLGQQNVVTDVFVYAFFGLSIVVFVLEDSVKVE